MAESHEKSNPSIGAWSNTRGAIIYAHGDGAGAGILPGSLFAFSENTVGAIFLGVISLILLIALWRTHARYRHAMERLAELAPQQGQHQYN